MADDDELESSTERALMWALDRAGKEVAVLRLTLAYLTWHWDEKPVEKKDIEWMYDRACRASSWLGLDPDDDDEKQ